MASSELTAQLCYDVGDKYNILLREYIGGQLHMSMSGGCGDPHIRFPTKPSLSSFTSTCILRPGYKAIMDRAGYGEEFMRDPRRLCQKVNPFSLHILNGEPVLFQFIPDLANPEDTITFTMHQDAMPGVLAHTYGADDKLYATLYLGYPASEQARVILFLLHMDKYFEDHLKEDKMLRVLSNEGPFWEEDCILKFKSLDSIFMRKEDISRICSDIDRFLSPATRKIYDYFGVTYKRTYLLSGLPGSGKSSLIRGLACKYGYNMCMLNYTETKDSHIQSLLKRLPEKSFFVLEDFDSIIEERKKHDDATNKISFSGILKMLDGEYCSVGSIIFITTNYKDRFDPAMFRPGRIDFVMDFDVASMEQITDMFVHYMSLNPETAAPYSDEARLSEIRERSATFCKRIGKLGIPITGAILQQYLFRYFGNIEGAVSNVEEVREMYNALPNDNGHKALYT
jgi:chaperone BCS1